MTARRSFERLAGAAARRPVLTLGIVLALALAGGGLALGLKPSAGTQTFIGSSSQTYRATAADQRHFGDDAVVILVHEPLSGLLGVRDLTTLTRLEACLAGQYVTADAKLGALTPVVHSPYGGRDSPCGRLMRARSAQVVYGPGTFLNRAVAAVNTGIRSITAGISAATRSAYASAYRLAVVRGLSRRRAIAEGQAAGRLEYERQLSRLEQLALSSGITSAPSIADTAFLDRIVFDPAVAPDQPKARFAYLFPTRASALIQVRLRSSLSDAGQARAISWIRQAIRMPMFRLPSGGSYVVSGVPVVVNDLSGQITAAIGGLLIAVLLAMALALALVFRSPRRLLPLAIALAATGITFGLLAVVGATLTMASIAVLPILIGLAVDYGIQFQARVQEARRAVGAEGEPAPSSEQAVARAAGRAAPTIATAALATATGFLVLLLSPVPMVRGFGVELVVGIFVALGCALSAGSAALALPGLRRVRGLLALPGLRRVRGLRALPGLRRVRGLRALPGLRRLPGLAAGAGKGTHRCPYVDRGGSTGQLHHASPTARPGRGLPGLPAGGAGPLRAALRGIGELVRASLRGAAEILRPLGGARGAIELAPATRSRPERLLLGVLRRPGRVLTLAAVLAVAGWIADSQTAVQSDVTKLVPQNTTTIRSLQDLERTTGVSGEIDVAVRGANVATPATVRWMVGYENTLLRHFGYRATGPGSPCLRATLCPALSLPDLFSTAGGGQSAPSASLTQSEINALLSAVPPYFSRAVLTADHREATLAFGIRLMSLAREQRAIDYMRSHLHPPPGVAAALTGLPVEAAQANASLSSTGQRFLTLIVALLAVGLVLGLVFRRPRRAVMPMVPIVLATGWSALVLYLIGIPLNPMSATLGTLVIAISTEFSVLLSERFGEERAAGHGAADALVRTYRSTGLAVLASGITAIVGFGVLVSSQITMLRDFGFVTLVDLTVSLGGVLIVLPAVLAISERGPARERVGAASGVMAAITGRLRRPARTA